ncbi:nicotinamidase/pyrazinamidase [Chlamydia trachomatis]|nr:nicotinamidase/pyrazinamidase [Chlamydia trachomatis]
MKVLVVVDMQNDFITGSLGTEEAVGIVKNVKEKIDTFDGKVYYTRDTHKENYLETEEGRNLPVKHCIEGTNGWKIHPELEIKGTIFDKGTFGSIKLGEELQNLNRENEIESVTLVGLCTDICVISNALLIKAYLPNTPIEVDKSCCAGVSVESHENALRAMEMNQIKII